MDVTVDVDLIRKQNIHFCMPCYGGMLSEQTLMGFVKWGNTARELGLSWTLETMTNESLITRGRNTLVSKFLNTPTSTHLMFIDADIGWEPWHMLALINHDVDVVGGLYPMKTLPIKWVVNTFTGAEERPNELAEVSKTGTGFMLIKREVFQKLNAHPAIKPFVNDIGLDPILNQYMKTYFDTAVREGRYYSEDWTFCENWRDLGGKVWVDKRVLLKHVGSFVYCNEAEQNLRSKFAEAPAPVAEVQSINYTPVTPAAVYKNTKDLSGAPTTQKPAVKGRLRKGKS